MKEEEIWKVRSKVYDQLDWTRRQEYMNAILQACDLKSNYTVCDIGTGTGVVAYALANYCKDVVGIDISSDMLNIAKQHCDKDNIVYKKIDVDMISEYKNGLFKDKFDVVTARMVFHHLPNWSRSIKQCYKILKPGGRIVISEGVPPVGALYFHKKFLIEKEERCVFTTDDIISLLEKNKFSNIDFKIHVMKDVSIRNWLDNSGLPKDVQNELYKMRLDSPKYAQKAENMKIHDGDILTDWNFTVVSGVK